MPDRNAPNEIEEHIGPVAWLGTTLLLGGAGLFCLAVVSRTTGLPFRMPGFWYTNGWLWGFTAVALVLAGCTLLRHGREKASDWRPSRPARRFQRLVVYTRRDCPLCDEAIETLVEHREFLPELQEVDVDADPQLAERFGDCVPVVELDGRVRFRGRVSVPLLRRLIEGSGPQSAASHSDLRDVD